MAFEIRPAESCRFDLVALGEVMLRLDPGEERIRAARSFRVWEGGGEYNVARGLRRCFGMRTAVVTALPDNEPGRLVESLMLQGGVDLSYVIFRPYDGVGRQHRLGLNFTERGFGIRGALGVSDRSYTAAAALRPGEVDWEKIFRKDGARWFHTGGIFAALSESTAALAMEALRAARAAGTVTSYDLNYRPSLWKAQGGRERAREVNRSLAPYVDVMLGNEEDFEAALGFEAEGGLEALNPESFKRMIDKVRQHYPNLKAVATTLRRVRTATRNDWGALLWYDGAFYQAVDRNDLEILDRVGGGDSFASGLIYGFLKGMPPGDCVEYGAAHGALAMTTPGDTSMATLAEVEKVVRGGGARVER